jgi:HAMP domain-containing protein
VVSRGARGAWRELVDGVNLVSGSLTSQVREIARVTTAVAKGDLSKTIDIEVRGEVEELKTTINTMVGQLSSFAAEVTRVSLEVGSEGRLGGQARVQGVSGVWRELTQSVNVMAENLTLQVRNIADVSAAIARSGYGSTSRHRGPQGPGAEPRPDRSRSGRDRDTAPASWHSTALRLKTRVFLPDEPGGKPADRRRAGSYSSGFSQMNSRSLKQGWSNQSLPGV